MTALCFAGCAASKESSAQQSESARVVEIHDTVSAMRRLTTTETIPESRVSLTVSLDSLRKLPEGAAYRKSNDRAHLEATHKDGVIYITGTCDSLQRLVEFYEELYHTARDSLDQMNQTFLKEQHKSTSITPYLDVLLLMFGCIIGTLSTIYIAKDKIFRNE